MSPPLPDGLAAAGMQAQETMQAQPELRPCQDGLCNRALLWAARQAGICRAMMACGTVQSHRQFYIGGLPPTIGLLDFFMYIVLQKRSTDGHHSAGSWTAVRAGIGQVDWQVPGL